MEEAVVDVLVVGNCTGSEAFVRVREDKVMVVEKRGEE